jgi:hypothetical protein
MTENRLKADHNTSEEQLKNMLPSNRLDRQLLLVSVLPVALTGLVFEWFLGHRHDYTGHYLAGFGASFAAVMLWLKTRPTDRFQKDAVRWVVPICLGCIAGGGITEATIFRIAKFDEIDFSNQSLGAVLALLCASSYVRHIKPSDEFFDRGLVRVARCRVENAQIPDGLRRFLYNEVRSLWIMVADDKSLNRVASGRCDPPNIA